MRIRILSVLWPVLWLVGEAQAAEPRIHRVAGGTSEMHANAYVIEGTAGLAVIATHGHPDHSGGVTQLVAGRVGTAVVAVLTSVDIGPAESHHDSAWIHATGDNEHAFVANCCAPRPPMSNDFARRYGSSRPAGPNYPTGRSPSWHSE